MRINLWLWRKLRHAVSWPNNVNSRKSHRTGWTGHNTPKFGAWSLRMIHDSGLARPQSAPCRHYHEVMNLWREEFQLKIMRDSVVFSKVALDYVSVRDFRCQLDWPIKWQLPALKFSCQSKIPATACSLLLPLGGEQPRPGKPVTWNREGSWMWN